MGAWRGAHVVRLFGCHRSATGGRGQPGMRRAHLGRGRARAGAQRYRAQDSNLDLTGQSRPSCRWTSPVLGNRLPCSRKARVAVHWRCRGGGGEPGRREEGVGRPGVAPGRVRRRRLYRPPRLSSGLPPRGWGARSAGRRARARGARMVAGWRAGPSTAVVQTREGPPGFDPRWPFAELRGSARNYDGRTSRAGSLLENRMQPSIAASAS